MSRGAAGGGRRGAPTPGARSGAARGPARVQVAGTRPPAPPRRPPAGRGCLCVGPGRGAAPVSLPLRGPTTNPRARRPRTPLSPPHRLGRVKGRPARPGSAAPACCVCRSGRRGRRRGGRAGTTTNARAPSAGIPVRAPGRAIVCAARVEPRWRRPSPEGGETWRRYRRGIRPNRQI